MRERSARSRAVTIGTAVVACLGLLISLAALVAARNDGDADKGRPAAATSTVPRAPSATASPVPSLSPDPTPAAASKDSPLFSDRTEVVTDGRFDPAEIYRRESQGVVTVISIFKGGGSLDRILGGGDDDEGGAGQGSGFVLNEQGEIATNAHVVTTGEGAGIRRASQVYVEFADGNQVPARIVGHDPNSDVALIRVDPKGLDIDPLPLGTSEDLEVGSPVAAMGSPFGQRQSLSVGIVSAKGRSIRSLTEFSISDAIQTDAAINKGNSGGPLVGADGRVIGINSQINTTTGDGSGVGFAVPIETVKSVLEQLRENGKVSYAYLGVSSQNIYPQLARRFKLPVTKGAWLQTVAPNGPAGKAGLRAGPKDKETIFQATPVIPGGDIITGVSGRRVESPEDLSAVLSHHKPGDKVTLEVWRGDKKQKIDVTLSERPARVASP